MAEETPKSYGGKYLRVDLSSGRLWSEQLDEETHRKYVGGTGYGTKVLYEEVPPGVEWSDPANRVTIASGPLGGTRVNGSGTISLVTKGPMTNGAVASQANGFMGAYMRFNGFDGMVLQGAAASLKYLYLHNGKAELRDAEHLAGLDVWEMADRLVAEIGVDESRLSVFGIGPAGENLVRFAAFTGDRGHVAGHNGTGAVLGSKRLKAIVAQRARGQVPAYDRKALAEVAKTIATRITGDPVAKEGTPRWGTLRLVARSTRSGSGTLPVKNYTTSIYNISPEELEKWDGPYLQEHHVTGRHNCWGCHFEHCTTFTIPDGPYKGFVGEEPEYEQFAAFGPVIGNTDVNAAIVLANECDRLGFENNEMGWLIGLVMECYDKGLLTRERLNGLDMRWGNVEAVRALIRMIAHREGIGDLLAEGVMRAAQEIGGEAVNFAIHTAKGNTPRGHDHRSRWTEMFDTATSNTSTLETGNLASMPRDSLQAIGVEGQPNAFSTQEVSTFTAKTKGAMIFEDSLGVCRFTVRIDVPYLAMAVNAATGWDMDVQEAMRVGLRAVNLLRAFNIRHGIGPELDVPSKRYGSTPIDGPAAGVSIQPDWNEMLANYYQLLGWDEKGVPKRETLVALGIGQVADDLGVAV
jgi:aldehyde:ferredoxin oxidoreductase